MLAEPTAWRYVEPDMRKPFALMVALLGLLLLFWWWQGGSRELGDLSSNPSALVAAAEPLAPEPAEALPTEQAVERQLAEDQVSRVGEEAPAEDLTLVLLFFSAETAAPVSGVIQLWKLNVPENEDWTAGDLSLLETEVQNGRLEVPNLEPGFYRVHILFALEGSPASLPFEFELDQQQVEFVVSVPSKKTAYITWLRPDGTVLRGEEDILERRWEGGSSRMVSDPTPVWVNPRYRKTEEGLAISVGSRGAGGRFGMRLHQEWRRPEGIDGRFSLGPIEQDSRLWRHTTKSRWRRGERLEIELQLNAEGTEDYACVFVEPRDIQARLIFPAGVAPRDLQEEIHIQCEPVGFGPRPTFDDRPVLHAEQAWRQSLLRIRIQTPDFEPVEISWRPIDGPLPSIVLTSMP